MPEIEYHAADGLSSTGMKWLLRSPKHYRQAMDHRVEKAAFDLGHCVHAKVLGVGMGVVVIPEERALEVRDNRDGCCPRVHRRRSLGRHGPRQGRCRIEGRRNRRGGPRQLEGPHAALARR